jgi:hypothetical protein
LSQALGSIFYFFLSNCNNKSQYYLFSYSDLLTCNFKPSIEPSAWQ